MLAGYLGQVITEEVYSLLESRGGLQRREVKLEGEEGGGVSPAVA